MDIVSPYPLWYFIFCILIGAIYAFVLYRKDKKLSEFAKWLVAILGVLRLISVSIICVLLLSPLVKYFSRTVEKPIIIVATDNSASMKMNADSVGVGSNLNNSIAALQSQLGKQYDVTSFLFDAAAEQQDSAAKFNGEITNYQALFSTLDDRFVNRNVGGMVLITDGIYNQGSNPLYLAENISYPIYTVATGDTTIVRDAKVAQVRNNEIAFLGNDFPLEMDLKIDQAKGEQLTLNVLNDGNTVYSKKITSNTATFNTTLKTNLAAKKIGVQKYTVEINALENERNLLNNRMSFYIDVLDGRQKIGLFGIAPHPDISAIRNSLEKNENYEIKTSLLKDINEIETFDLIILHQSATTNQVINGTLKKIVESNIPLLIIGNGWSNLDAQFGVNVSGGNMNAQVNETYPILNENFSLFTISKGLGKQLKRFPPLNGFSAKATNKNANTTLFYQKIGAVNTQYPLFVFYENQGRKIARFYADGLWKWAINDFVENRNHEKFNELMSKSVQYLAIKSDKSNFRVNTANEYFENEEIVFNAQVFNDSYELVNDEEVGLTLIDESEKQYEFNFNRNQKSYQLTIASLPAGRYKYEASTNLQGVKYLENGTFTVKELQLEQIETVANHNLLYQLAEKSGGKLIYPTKMQEIIELFAARKDINSISYVNEEVEDLINIRWIFFVIAGLFVLEWFIRKRGGAY